MSRKPESVLENIEKLELKKPSDMIIVQIKDLISSGLLKPGDRLPAERIFAERFGVGRGHIREALKKLECYGILKTMPQSGTYVASLGAKALEGLISNLLALESDDLDSLLEIRGILEINAAKLAATRSSNTDIIALIRAHEGFRKQVRNQEMGIQEDRHFHLKIAESANNNILYSLITLLIDNTASGSDESQDIAQGREHLILEQHEAILQAIKQKNPVQAAAAMEAHIGLR